ncbi:hypothetical protein IFM60648_07249 [Aspergillus lentulus]|uniref:Protein kinase domain-containing protein n=1 Tax=Aspergillus lentulus TaxID=293939 RepID=A0ABQ1AND1_ASPLE|nr:hypothetical protein IFM60648_07249 [Aspergillus lentulus]
MEVASLVLAVAGTLDLCLKYGKSLVMLCREQRNLESDLEEISLTFEGLWIKTEIQLQSVKALWTTLPPALQAHYGDVLSHLQIKITGAFKTYERVTAFVNAAYRIQRRVRAVYLKRHLQQIVLDLEEWQKRFDPSWYLITRIANPLVDQQLGSSVSSRDPSMRRLKMMRKAIQACHSGHDIEQGSVFKNAGVIADSMSQISGTNTYLSNYRHNSRPVLLDRICYKAGAVGIDGRKNVRDLARLLLHVEPDTFSLLKCSGVVELGEEGNTQFQYIFEIPEGLSTPKTLRSLLREMIRCSLSQRFQLAKHLARSVMFLHATGFVHKNIRPETMIVFANTTGSMRQSFLIGFESIRKEGGSTERIGDLEWERNLYRHPMRQGLFPEDVFTMEHDIYSLGVCLLEVGMWSSFALNEGDAVTPCGELEISNALADNDPRRRGFAVKDRLVQLSKERLPSLVGDRYSEIVKACLCCLDRTEENSFQPSELRDDDGIIVGVRYIENILSKIEELCV